MRRWNWIGHVLRKGEEQWWRWSGSLKEEGKWDNQRSHEEGPWTRSTDRRGGPAGPKSGARHKTGLVGEGELQPYARHGAEN